jgi:hypothetical protein
MELLAAMGIPTAITGLLVWWLKRYIDRRDKKAEEREKNTEKLMLIIMQNSRATNILAEATARAVQRIPDAKCNGDIPSLLHIFGSAPLSNNSIIASKFSLSIA